MTKSHEKKAVIQGNSLYIVGPKDSAYAHHFLNLNKVTAEQADWLLAESKPVTDWTRLFHVLGGYDENLDDNDVADVELKLVVDLPVGMTPKHRRL